MKIIGKELRITAFVILGLFMFCYGLFLFKDSYAAVTTSEGSYRYRTRWQSGYSMNYIRGGHTQISNKDDIGYMTIQSDSGSSLQVYCALRGKQLSSSVDYHRVPAEEYFGSGSSIINIVKLFSPGDSVESLKSYLRTNFSSRYQSAGLANLTSGEAVVAAQSAIWVYTNGDRNYNAKTDDSARNTRINALHDIFTGSLPNVSSSSSSVSFRIRSNLSLNGSSKYEMSFTASKSFSNSDISSIEVKTSRGTVISDSNYTVGVNTAGTNTLSITFNTGVFTNNGGDLYYGSELVDTLYVKVSAYGAATSAVYAYHPSDSNYQPFVGVESSRGTSTSNITVSVPRAPVVVNSKVSLEIDKVDEDDTNLPSLGNAYLKLYRVEGSNSILITEWLTSAGNKKVINDLVPGTYKIVETMCPVGYQISTKANSTNGSTLYVSSDKTFTLTDAYTTYSVHVNNKKTSINIAKTNTARTEAVAGAVFSIVDFESVEQYRFTSVDDLTGVSILGLDEGIYFLVELEAPTNYIKSEVAYRFAVGSPDANASRYIVEGAYKDITIVDAELDALADKIEITNASGISISKKSIVSDTIDVIGATLRIIDSNNQVIEEWVSDGSSHVVTANLPDGDYTLTETIPAPGYATAESINFSILNNKVVNNTSLTMKDAPLNVCIAKVASNVSGNLAGAEFEVYDAGGRLITAFTSTDQMKCFGPEMGLKAGSKYKVKEVKAPAGYKGIGEKEITIRDTGDKQVFEISNEVSVPSTSKNPQNIIYIAILIMGSIGIGLVCTYAKRYN